MQSFYNRIVGSGESRSVKARKNIIGSFGIKGLAILIGFIKVPIILSYLDAEKYGIWLTIASIVDWVHYFDLGLGHGLRNRFAEAMALNNHVLARKLVSTTYYYTTIIFGSVFFVLLPIVFVVNWQSVLNTSTISLNELTWSVFIVLLMFVFRFIFFQISVILKGDQRPALSDLFMPLANILTLVFILLLKLFSNNSLLLACLAISVPPALTLFIANIYFFSKDYYQYTPSTKYKDKTLFKDTITLGVKFFIIQLASLVVFASSNLILTQTVNPTEVTLFNISRQYYIIPSMFFSIILSPYWTAITDAYTLKEIDWIKNIMRKLVLIGVIFCVCEIVWVLLSPIAFKLWIGDMVYIPLQLSVISAVYFATNIMWAPFTHFLNGVGKLKISVLLASVQMAFFIPVALFFSSKWGASGLFFSLIIVSSIPLLLINIFQYYIIVNKKAKGIWNE